MQGTLTLVIVAAGLLGVSGAAFAEDTEALAKAAQNPIANMISVPFQNNFNFGIGPNKVTQWDLNVQPVIPISLNEDWNLITRTVIPIIEPALTRARCARARLAWATSIRSSTSPRPRPGGLIWGVGPTFTLPTGHRFPVGQRQMERGPVGRGADHPGPLGRGGGGQPAMVLCRLG